MKGRVDLICKLILGIFLVTLIFPLIIILVWSFAKNWTWPKLLPGELGLRGWSYFVDPKSKSLQTLILSLVLSSTVTMLSLLISIPAAKALALYRFKGKRLIEMLIIAPVIVPASAVAMGIHLQFIKLGLANTFLGVVVIQIIPCMPYCVRIMKNVYEIVGEDMEVQARVLGANHLQTFLNITLPMIMPGIISAGSMAFIVSFSQYFLTLLIGGGRIVTLSMVMFPYIKSGDRMMGSVYSIVFIMSTLIFLYIIEKATNRFYKGRLKEYYYV